MNHELMDYLSMWKVKSRRLGSSCSVDCDFIESLYKDEPWGIFEHSPYHIASYFAFEHEVYIAVSDFWKGVIGIGEKEIIFFTPNCLDENKFGLFLKGINLRFNNYHIKIQNVSASWKERYPLVSTMGKIFPRSKEEVVYNTDTLCSLKGNNFENLRNARNKLLKSNLLQFQPMAKGHVENALKVVKKWQEVQGSKYTKNKLPKEIFVCQSFARFSEQFPESVVAEVGYLAGNPVSYCLFHRNNSIPGWGTIYTIKGLNRIEDGGCRGTSDATYLHCFEMAQRWGLKHLNDGELGSEPGTRAHKQRFKPCQYLQSFDLILLS